MKRVLILMSKTGGGHLASAEALKAVFELEYGAQDVQVSIVDLLMDYLAWPLREFPKSYGWIANRTPWLWERLYAAGQRPWLAEPILGLTAGLSITSLMNAIEQHQPDLVVSVHPLVQDLALPALARLGSAAPYAIVVTDLTSIHPLWFHPRARVCFVASEAARQAGLAAGLRPEQLRLTGLPVRPVFATTPRPRAELRTELGMDADLPAALLVGGGEGVGRVAVIARAVARELADEGGSRGQLVVICGRNRRLQALLAKAAWPVPVQIRGFVTNMSDWMAACDCIVTKAGPGTIAESLIRGLPILLSGYIPGQEEGNVPFVLENRVGLYSAEPQVIAEHVRRWFGPGRAELAEMAAWAQALANPRSTYDIVDELAGLMWPARAPKDAANRSRPSGAS
jgi:1,2-diacylglycerol 3-beta-galactosyltransferase